MDYKETYQAWLDAKGLDPALRAELLSIADDPGQQEERFYTELAFGTAGLRGVLGAGTNRMNVHVVRRATQGLADYLNTFPDARERGVAIAYDSRHMSDAFARESALVLAQNGIPVYLYDTLHSVPQLSFTILHLHCKAGIVITASHNPPAYNGYKVYWEHGGQAGPEQAKEILQYIQKVDYFSVQPMEQQAALSAGLLKMIGKEVDEAYYASIKTLLLHPELVKEKGKELKLVYTPSMGQAACLSGRSSNGSALLTYPSLRSRKSLMGIFPPSKPPTQRTLRLFPWPFPWQTRWAQTPYWPRTRIPIGWARRCAAGTAASACSPATRSAAC